MFFIVFVSIQMNLDVCVGQTPIFLLMAFAPSLGQIVLKFVTNQLTGGQIYDN